MRVEFHERAGLPWQPIAGVVLAALLATLATLQYRWLGEVSEAERSRMRATLQTRAADFTQAFDRELTQIYVAFHGEPEPAGEGPARAIAASLARAQASATVPGLIRDVFLLEGQGERAGVLQRFNPASRALDAAEWPEPLLAWRRRAAPHVAAIGPVAGILPILLADAVDAAAPALVIPMPFVRRIDGGEGRVAVVPDPAGRDRALIVWLDADRLRTQLLEPLVARYFGAGDDSEFVVSIVPRDSPSTVVYASSKHAIVDEGADVSTGMFDLRMNEMTRLAGGVKPAVPGSQTTDRVAVTIVRRSNAPGDASRVLMTGGAGQGAWLVRARYRSGSLETIVARSRRRNVAISAAVLGLLGAAFMLILAAAQRQRRLARQQMEFVAAVSHELRTPLAVICSAGENLADGVVADPAQVKRYGTLIGTEGRRLGDMVERVLQFAGISSGARTRARAEVDLGRVIADAVDGAGADARERGVTVAVHAAAPAAAGDGRRRRAALGGAEPRRQRGEVQPRRRSGGRHDRRRGRRHRAHPRRRSRHRHRRGRPAAHLSAVLPRPPRRRRAGARQRRRAERRAARRAGARRGRPDRQPRGRRHHGHGGAPADDRVRPAGRPRSGRAAEGRTGERRVVSLSPRILLVEDEAGLRLTLTDRLGSEGYSVETAGDGETGLARASGGGFDLIVLDVMLPRMNGFDVCREVRQRGVTTPILMLTARGQVVDKVVGLKLGADDYLTKPFETIELMARLEALLRRRPSAAQPGGEAYRFGDVVVDFRRMEVTRAGATVELSAREFKLLRHFIEHRGATLSRDALLAEVWGYDEMPLTRTVDVHVAGLRQKVEANPRSPEYILTVHGLGYKFAG